PAAAEGATSATSARAPTPPPPAPAPPANLYAIEIQRVLRIDRDFDSRERAIRREIEVARGEKCDGNVAADLVPGPDPLRASGDIEKFVRIEEIETMERADENQDRQKRDREVAHQRAIGGRHLAGGGWAYRPSATRYP